MIYAITFLFEGAVALILTKKTKKNKTKHLNGKIRVIIWTYASMLLQKNLSLSSNTLELREIKISLSSKLNFQEYERILDM